MDIEVLRNFLKLSETLNFTKTSDKVFIAQPALSRQIKKLEDELSIVLFKRNKRNVELTPAGAYFRNEVQKIINQLDYCIKQSAQIEKGEMGEIRIAYTHSVMQSFLPDLVKKLNHALPGIKIILIEMSNTRQVEAIRNREIDISLSTNPTIKGNLKSKVLKEENFAVVLPKNHPINHSNFVSVAQFEAESFILAPKADGELYVGIIESICIDAGYLPNVIHESSHASTVIRLVEAGIGITIEPLSGLIRYHNNNIKYIELKNIKQKAIIVMLWNADLESTHAGIFSLINDFDFYNT